MLPTPDTSHVPYERVYEPAEDSFLLIDTLAAPAERRFLCRRLGTRASSAASTTSSGSGAGNDDGNGAGNDDGSGPANDTGSARRRPPPLVVEVGTGSGVVLAFVHAHARAVLGAGGVLTAGVDVSAAACRATVATVAKAERDVAASSPSSSSSFSSSSSAPAACYLGACVADLVSAWRDSSIDLLLCNPPYVPTPSLPARPDAASAGFDGASSSLPPPSFERDSYLLSLAYAGGRDGMETTRRLVEALPRVLSPAGCAYVLLCAQNRPQLVKERVRGFGPGWRAETVSSSGKTAGWEKLQVVRVWHQAEGDDDGDDGDDDGGGDDGSS